MNILHLISSAGFYGAENMVAALSVDLRKMGHSIQVGVFENSHRARNKVAQEIELRGVSVVRIPCQGRVDRETLRAIRQAITSHNTQVLHCHGYKTDLYGYIAAQQTRVPMVATCHLWTASSLSVRFYEYLDSLTLRRAARVVGVSDLIANALRDAGIPAPKVMTIYNGTDLSRFERASNTLREQLQIGTDFLIGTVGRLEEQKGLEYFIRAAKGIISEIPNAMFVVVGEGSLRPTLKALIDKLGLGANVRLIGEQSDMPGVYASLDVFVLASIDEGLPMTILEALAASRPVVASRVGAIDKVIVSGRNGILVEPRDVPALQNAILQCVRDRDFSRKIGEEGRKQVTACFSAEAMARNYEQVYRQVIDEFDCAKRLRTRATMSADAWR